MIRLPLPPEPSDGALRLLWLPPSATQLAAINARPMRLWDDCPEEDHGHSNWIPYGGYTDAQRAQMKEDAAKLASGRRGRGYDQDDEKRRSENANFQNGSKETRTHPPQTKRVDPPAAALPPLEHVRWDETKMNPKGYRKARDLRAILSPAQHQKYTDFELVSKFQAAKKGSLERYLYDQLTRDTQTFTDIELRMGALYRIDTARHPERPQYKNLNARQWCCLFGATVNCTKLGSAACNVYTQLQEQAIAELAKEKKTPRTGKTPRIARVMKHTASNKYTRETSSWAKRSRVK